MKKNHALLIIDAQNDFCDPFGSLYVEGAEKDMQKLAGFIIKNQSKVDHICLTLDSHPVLHIAHPFFWYNTQGEHPHPFTVITSKDVEQGLWKTNYRPEQSLNYLKQLEAQGQFPHMIWPLHCVTGSWGFAIHNSLMKAIVEWAKLGKFHQIISKGSNPYTEHFGIFASNIPLDEFPDTHINYELIYQLNEYEHIWIAGEAKSHCVATSLNQLLTFQPEMASKIYLLEDCMSDVAGLGQLGEPIYQKAREMGVHFENANAIL